MEAAHAKATQVYAGSAYLQREVGAPA